MILLDLTHISVAERIAKEERLRAEEEAAIAQAEAAKCEAERAAAAEAARLQMQREEEAEKQREQQKAEGRAAARNPAAARVGNGEAPAAWRRTSPANTTPSPPSRAQAATPP